MARKRKKSERELERNKDYQKVYYATNREELRAKKAERYRNDEEYRRGIRTRARKRHWLGNRLDNKDFPPFGDFAKLEPKGSIEVTVNDPTDARHGQMVVVPVYSTGAVAELLGRAPEVLRLWWKRKQVPEPHYRGSTVPQSMVKGRNPRLFTRDEMLAFDAVKERLNLPSKKGQLATFAEGLREEFAKMKDGLYRVPS